MNRTSNKAQRILAFLKRILKRTLVFLLVLLVLSSGSWVADGIKGEVLFLDWFGSWGLSVAIFVFFAASGLLYRLRRAFANIQTLSEHECDPHKSLILLVSTPTLGIELDAKSRMLRFDKTKFNIPKEIIKSLDGQILPSWIQIPLSNNLHRDIESLDKLPRWNWQQMMRAIRPHIAPEDRLLRLHLIGSTGGRGSLGHLDSCKKWLKGYLPGVEITRDELGVDFGKFNAMVQHIQKVIDEQKKGGKGKVKFTDKDIVIDVTGGTTTASIAGASTTLNTKVTFQYVDTNDPDKVSAYDVAYHLPHDE